MKLTRLFLSALSITGIVVATGSCDEATPDDDGTDTTEQSITVELPTFKIPTGESFKCYYSDVITDKDLSVVAASGAQVAGGHHLSLYYVDNERPAGIEDCSGSTEMIDWHFVVGAGGEGVDNAQLELAEGLAFKIPKGKQLMIQAHYINVSGAEMDSADALKVELTDPEDVEDYAADFVIDDDHFEIEAHAEYATTMTCEVPQDVQLTMLLGHMHEQGAHFKLERVNEAGETEEILYEQEWEASYASHPPTLAWTKQEPLLLKQGTLLRQTCQWKNETDKKLLFPTEMCIGFGYYFPGTERIMCERVETTDTP